GHVPVGLQHERRLATLGEAMDEEVVVEREPVLRVGKIVFSFGVGLGDEHAARYAPDARIGAPADLLAAFDVALPVAAEVSAVEELAGDGDPAPLAGCARARRVRR